MVMKKSSPLPIVLRNREPVFASEVPSGEYDPIRNISVLDGIPLVELTNSRTAVTKSQEGIDQSEVCDTEATGKATIINCIEEDLAINKFEFGGTTSTRTNEGIDQPEASEIVSYFEETTSAAKSIDGRRVLESQALRDLNRTSITATCESIDQSECVNDYYD
jgi:hypothetical protein